MSLICCVYFVLAALDSWGVSYNLSSLFQDNLSTVMTKIYNPHLLQMYLFTLEQS